jgi:hypothetical protein
MAERYETVVLGVLDLGEAEIDIRIVRVSSAGTYGVVFGGSLAEGALSSIEQAKALAGDGAELAWRDGLGVEDNECPCAICGAPVPLSPRTPQRVCVVCALEAVDAEGRTLRFSNDDLTGGFVAIDSNGTHSTNHECFVRGVRCWADEAHFGGIVLVLRPRTP